MLFAIAVYLDLDITQIDVKTAFLYRLIDKLIYQSPRLWYKTLEDHLRKSLDLKYLNTDYSIFVSNRGFNRSIITVFVDDIKILSLKDTDYGAIVRE